MNTYMLQAGPVDLEQEEPREMIRYNMERGGQVAPA